MFEYCLGRLGYSASAAARRIRSARCIRDYPEVYRLLEKNEVTLITISLVAPILEETNAKDLIEKIRGKSQREVEAIVASYRPPVSLRDRARPVTVAVPASSAAPTQWTSRSVGASAGSEKTPNIAAASFAGGPPEAATMTQAQRQAGTSMQAQRQATASPADTHSSPRLETKFHVQFLASERFMKKLEKAKALLSNKTSGLSYEFVLEAALDEFLKDHDPKERKIRRDAREELKGRRQLKEREATRRDGTCPQNTEKTRRIPAALNEAVFARDKGRCTYMGSSGKRCDATHNLEIDHVIPYARGGTNAIDNLRLLCERHNKLEAERIYGANVMKRFRARE
jgi:5-methylcytosine-specific restriction endonuclease McrA